MNRKHFFNQVGRLMFLGGIAGISGYLILNDKVTANCSESITCRNCQKYVKCELPKANKEKNGK